MLNLYLVVSETLYEKVPILDYGEGPLEPYSICELILAPTRGKAKWLAWKEDKSFNSDIINMPKFRTRIVSRKFEGETKIVSNLPSFKNFWGSPIVNECISKSNRENF